MLDVVLFRTDQGGNPDLIRESQRRRYADVGLVDKVIEYDTEGRTSKRRRRSSARHFIAHRPCARACHVAARGNLDLANKALNITKKSIGEFMKKKEKPPDEMFTKKAEEEAEIKRLEEKVKELQKLRDDTIGTIGARAASNRIARPRRRGAARQPRGDRRPAARL